MNRDQLINQVKSKIDELSPSDALIVAVGTEDNKPIDTIIGSLLDESAIEVLLKAPVHRLSVTKCATASGTATTGDAFSGSVAIPADFLRLVEFKMTEWKRPVTEFQPQGSPLAQRQYNVYLRAGINKPVAVISHRDAGMVAEYYTVLSAHTIERFLYIKRDVAENIPVVLQDALCWICASKVLSIFSKINESKSAIENAVSLMQ